jgi:hypothetical protein
MGGGAIFFWFFAGLFVLRIIAATFVYAWLLSEAPECPACGSETLRVERRGVAWLFPRLRPSWCPACAWEGMLQPVSNARLTHVPPESTNTDNHSGQFPLISRKSSK